MESALKTGRRRVIQLASQVAALLLWPYRRRARARPSPATGAEPLEAVARVVLPGGLTDQARRQVVTGFWRWVDGFQPDVDLMATEDTAYLLELPFARKLVSARASPRQRYQAQLRSLDDEAREERGIPFSEIDPHRQEQIVRRQIEKAVDELALHDLNPLGAPVFWLPGPAAFVGTPADHVALTLMAFYFNSAEGVERSLGHSFGERTCRGFSGVAEEPPRGRF